MTAGVVVIALAVSFYIPKLGGINGGSRMANGQLVRPAHHMTVVACGPRFKFGTVFVVDGLGTFVCKDRGGRIHNGRLDVLLNSGDAKADLKFAYRHNPRHKWSVRVIAPTSPTRAEAYCSGRCL